MVHINYEDFCKEQRCVHYNLIERLKSLPKSSKIERELAIAEVHCAKSCERTAYQFHEWLKGEGISFYINNSNHLRKKWASELNPKDYPFAQEIIFCQNLEKQGYGLRENGSEKTESSIVVVFPNNRTRSFLELKKFFINNKFNPKIPEHIMLCDASRYARTYAMI